MFHRNARLTVHGRRLIVERHQAGWKQAHIAAAMEISRKCARTWIVRYEVEGERPGDSVLTAAHDAYPDRARGRAEGPGCPDQAPAGPRPARAENRRRGQDGLENTTPARDALPPRLRPDGAGGEVQTRPTAGKASGAPMCLAGSRSHNWAEVTRILAANEIAEPVRLQGLDQEKVKVDRTFITYLLPSMTQVPSPRRGWFRTRRGEEPTDSGFSGTDPFSEVALWGQFQLNFPRPVFGANSCESDWRGDEQTILVTRPAPISAASADRPLPASLLTTVRLPGPRRNSASMSSTGYPALWSLSIRTVAPSWIPATVWSTSG